MKRLRRHLGNTPAENLRISKICSVVFAPTVYYLFDDLYSGGLKQWCREQDVDILVLDIGSNDLANLTEADEHVIEWAGDLVSFAGQLPVSRVVLNYVIPREANIRSTKTVFRINADKYNASLNGLVLGTKCAVNKQQGFANWYDPINRMVIHRPVESWSEDGIHVTKRFWEKYVLRLRSAIFSSQRFTLK